jgi:hypothetical protein
VVPDAPKRARSSPRIECRRKLEQTTPRQSGPVGEQLNQHRTGASVIQRLECLDRAQLAEALQLDDTSRQIWDDIGTASNQFELGLFPRAERSFSCAISATTLSATSSSLDREVTDGE